MNTVSTRNFTINTSAFITNLVLSKQDIQCDVMLHAHLEVEAFPHATLAWLW